MTARNFAYDHRRVDLPKVNDITSTESVTLSDEVRRTMVRYFQELNGQDPSELYQLVISQVEPPLLEIVLRQTRGNISRAANLLGMNRATLRKKLLKYGLGD